MPPKPRHRWVWHPPGALSRRLEYALRRSLGSRPTARSTWCATPSGADPFLHTDAGLTAFQLDPARPFGDRTGAARPAAVLGGDPAFRLNLGWVSGACRGRSWHGHRSPGATTAAAAKLVASILGRRLWSFRPLLSEFRQGPHYRWTAEDSRPYLAGLRVLAGWRIICFTIAHELPGAAK
jgi:hypothetical protein